MIAFAFAWSSGSAVLGYVVKQEIEGDEAVELNILGLIHHTHSPVGVRQFGNYEAWVDL
jgi:hypothetical protein